MPRGDIIKTTENFKIKLLADTYLYLIDKLFFNITASEVVRAVLLLYIPITLSFDKERQSGYRNITFVMGNFTLPREMVSG